MNIKKYIICLGTKPWGSTPHRTQQLMSQLKNVNILYFYPQPNKNASKVYKKKVRPNVFVYSLPHPIFTSTKQFATSFYPKQLAHFITKVCIRHRVRHPMVWATHPSQAFLVAQLRYKSLVFDCRALWGEGWQEQQADLALSSDLILVTSPTIQKELSKTNKNTILLENGVHYPLFSCSEKIPSKQEIYLGFAGVIDPQLDLSHLVYAAKTQPQWRFLLVGPCAEDNPFVPQLKSLFNVKFLGVRPQNEIPDFLASCHVLLDFRHTNKPMSDVTSIRFYEYLSTGRPILATMWHDDIERFPDVVYWASTEGEYVSLCHKAIQEDPNWVSQRRKNYGEQADWHIRSQWLQHTLESTALL